MNNGEMWVLFERDQKKASIKQGLFIILVFLISTGSLHASSVEDSIFNGTTWLIDNQNPDGSWGKEVDLASTAFSIKALESLGHDVSMDKQLLLSQDYNDSKELALVFFATRDSNTRSTLLARQSPDGSWEDISTTSLVTVSLADSGYFGGELTDATNYLRHNQNPDGSWGKEGYTKETALATWALIKAGINDNTTIKGANWLANAQRTDGSWGYMTDTAFALLALNNSIYVNETHASSVKT